MSHIGTRPPSGVKLSCMALTEPLDAAVVADAQMAELTMPKRVSFPSMLPPACEADGTWSAPAAASTGVPRCSKAVAAMVRGTRMTVIAAEQHPALPPVPDHAPEHVSTAPPE